MYFFRDILNFISGRTLGAILGLLAGITILIFGFFKALFIAFCVLVGWYIGNAIDKDKNIKEFLEKILPPRF